MVIYSKSSIFPLCKATAYCAMVTVPIEGCAFHTLVGDFTHHPIVKEIHSKGDFEMPKPIVLYFSESMCADSLFLFVVVPLIQ